MPPPHVRDDLRSVVDASEVARVTFRVDPSAELRPRQVLLRSELVQALLRHHEIATVNVQSSDAYLALDGAMIVTVHLVDTPVAGAGGLPL